MSRGELDELVAARVHRFGPLRFDELVDLALYHPSLGFYARGGGAGRDRDFLTSPEVGPLFGAVVARALDRWWRDLGEPDPYVVVEAGAGVGTLARDVLRAAPDCAPALRYVLVERADALRAEQERTLSLEPPRMAIGPVVAAGPDEGPHPVAGTGPLATSLAELPVGPLTGVVFANELLDNLPFRLLERTNSGWTEVFVDADRREVMVPAAAESAAEAARVAPDAPPGARVPLQHAAAAWLRAALGVLGRGRVVVVDYASTSASMATRPAGEWLRTYAGHGRGRSPLEHLGRQDITCEVAVDQLAHVRPPDVDRSQSEFLRAAGLGELVEKARAAWEARAHVGDLEAVRARSRVAEGAALTDESGLGAFRVLEWDAGR